MDTLWLARAAAQLLGSERATSALEVTERLIAVQGQDVGAARLAIRARSTGLTPADVAAAPLVRTWLMRGTLQYVAATDARWLLAVFGPINRAADARRRKQLGLDDGLCARATAALPELLADRPLGRDDLRTRLSDVGVAVPSETQAMPHLLAYAASTGALSLGPEISHGRPTYQPLDASDGGPYDRDEALAELARRYVRGHGLTEPADLAAWSGLGVRDAKRAFTLGRPEPAASAEGHGVRLLGHFDPYLLGYADKAFVVPEPFTERIRTGGGFVLPSVVVDGRAVATWRTKAGQICVDPFEPPLAADVRPELADLARFQDAAG